ncbi:hypothetical protein THAOC_35502, partial [Thalassiosira oceanica]
MSPEVLAAMKGLITAVLAGIGGDNRDETSWASTADGGAANGIGVGPETVTEQSGEALAQLCMWQLVVGFNLRELEVRENMTINLLAGGKDGGEGEFEVYWVDGTSAGLPGRRVDGVDDDGLNCQQPQQANQANPNHVEPPPDPVNLAPFAAPSPGGGPQSYGYSHQINDSVSQTQTSLGGGAGSVQTHPNLTQSLSSAPRALGQANNMFASPNETLSQMQHLQQLQMYQQQQQLLMPAQFDNGISQHVVQSGQLQQASGIGSTPQMMMPGGVSQLHGVSSQIGGGGRGFGTKLPNTSQAGYSSSYLDSSTNLWTNQQVGSSASIPGHVLSTAASDSRTNVSADETYMPPSPSAKKKMKLMRKGLQLPQRKSMDEVRICLSQWVQLESSDDRMQGEANDELVFRKTSVAYGIVEILKAARRSVHMATSKDLHASCDIDNFTVLIQGDFSKDDDVGKIEGVCSINPPSSLKMITPYFSSSGEYAELILNVCHVSQLSTSFFGCLLWLSEFFGQESTIVGEYLEVEISPPPLPNCERNALVGSASEEMELSRLLGKLLETIYTQGCDSKETQLEEPSPSNDAESSASMLQLGFSHSVHLLISDLLRRRVTLDEASADLHQMLLEPRSFLYGRYCCGEPLPLKSTPHLHSKGKLYGRDRETRLVSTVLPYVSIAGGYVVAKKFTQNDNNPLSLVIGAFDDLIILLKENCSAEQLRSIEEKVASKFGTNFLAVLRQTLPALSTLFANSDSCTGVKQESAPNSSGSLSFTLKIFLNAVWADERSLEIMADVLSGKGSCVFIVCCYRDNEIDSSMLGSFVDNLNQNAVRLQMINLIGMEFEDLHSLISDALCMLPRHCLALCGIVHAKTKGNPLFAEQFMKALVEGKLLSFSEELKSWTWDTVKIECLDMTANVLHLLQTKMRVLDDEIQNTLFIAACFGNGLKKSLVCRIAKSRESLESNLQKIVKLGIMTASDSGFKFNHDKFREAATSLFRTSSGNEDEFRYSLGIELLGSGGDEYSADVLFEIVELINSGLHLIEDKSERRKFADLNNRAGKAAVAMSDFSRALVYFKTSLSLLDSDHWAESQCHLSIELHLAIAHCARACSVAEEAESHLLAIIKNGKSTPGTLDAHFHLNILRLSTRRSDEAFESCTKLLTELGEHAVPQINEKDTTDILVAAHHRLKALSDEQLLAMHDIPHQDIKRAQFLFLATQIASTSLPSRFVVYFVCRLLESSLDDGCSKYSSFALVSVGTILCGSRLNAFDNGRRIGKIGMRLFEEKYYEPSLLCAHYLSYYGYIAPLFENLPDVASKLKRALDVGLGMGFVSNQALMAGQHYIQKSFFAGTSLTTILAENEKNGFPGKFVAAQSNFLPQSSVKNKFQLTDTEEGYEYEGFALVQLFHRAIQSFWLEHYDRCNYFVSKSTNDKVCSPCQNSKADLRKLQVKPTLTHTTHTLDLTQPPLLAAYSLHYQGIYCFFYQATSASALLRLSKKRLSELTGGKFPIWHFPWY